MIRFTEQDILNSFPQKTVQKARPYAARKVLTSHWQGNQLIGLVDGSDMDPYEVWIDVSVGKSGAILFKNHCSCFIGLACKHVVALLLHEAKQQRNQPSTQSSPSSPIGGINVESINRYMHQIYATTNDYLESLPKDIAPSSEGMIFVIKLGGLYAELIPTKIRRLKDGQLSSSSSPVTAWGNYVTGYGRTPAYVSEFDLSVLKLMYADKVGYGHYQLSGELGELIIRKLVTHNKLFTYLDDRLTTIVAQDPIELVITWQKKGQHLWQLTHNLPIEGPLRLIETSPPFLLTADPAKSNVNLSAIISPLPTKLIVALLHHPVGIPADHLFELWQPIADVYDGLPALPQQVQPEMVVHPTIPLLKLVKTETRTVTKLAANVVAKMQFRYGNHLFKPTYEPIKTSVIEQENGQQLIIQRDSEKEFNLVKTLLDQGLDYLTYGYDEDAIVLAPNTHRHAVSIHALDWIPYLPLFETLKTQGWQIHIDLPELNQIEVSNGVSVNLLDDDHDYALEASLITPSGEVPLLPLLHQYLADDKPLPEQGEIYLEKPDGGYVRVDVAHLAPIFQTITELYDRPLNTDGRLQLNQFDVMGLSNQQIKVKGQKAKALRQMVSQLANISGIEPVDPPKHLQASLRDYQQQGYSWLHFLSEHQLGGILADDMGLGKTLQVISYLLKQQQDGKLTQPSLVIAPTSVVGNWMAELAKFAPSLNALRFDGSDRKTKQAKMTEAQVVVTSFALIQRDADFWQEIALHSVIVDEAQYIKNSKAKTAQVIRQISCNHRLCLTGTPMENHLGELWSLFDFVMPGFLADEQTFKKRYRNPIEQHGDQDCQGRLSQRVSPFMLRRTKSDVVQELPPKTEIIQRVTLDKAQWQLYSSVRLSMEQRVRELMAEKGLKRSHIEILDALLKLRQACCDPRLLKIPAAEKVKHSAKLEALVEMVTELVSEGRKILIFSQFATMLGLIEEALKKEQIRTSKLTGQTRNRQQAIDAFTKGDAQVFLISLKAGGVGLNLTAADTVIHYDPWWNPAAESQATDRAYRMGQDKPVFVYKLIAENTVEEKILTMQAKKQALADSLFGDEDALSVWSDSETILGLFSEQT